jgi:glyoxylase-like metal-dependent hydrolase (beta-lactamase superfamily II)
MQLAPNLHRIGSDLVNAYLVADDAGVTIVDTGVSGMWKEVEPELARMGRGLSEVRGVLLTHGDVDHVGFAERLASSTVSRSTSTRRMRLAHVARRRNRTSPSADGRSARSFDSGGTGCSAAGFGPRRSPRS